MKKEPKKQDREFIYTKDGKEHAMFQIGLNPDGSMQPIVHAVLPFADMDLLMKLLNTDRLGGDFHDLDDGTGYFFMYDNNRARPYPSVMIWKYKKEGAARVIEDAAQKDLGIIHYAADTYLKP